MIEFKTFDLNKVANGEEVLGDFLIKSIELKTAKNNKLFIEGELINSYVKIPFKLWDATNTIYEKLSNIKFARFKGTINEYMSTKQLIINNYKELPKNAINISNFIPTTNLNIEETKSFINNIINNIKNENYKNIINKLLIDEFYIHGAAKNNHHNKNGGLLEHTYQMLLSEKTLIENDNTGLYKNINLDLLYTGTILHDIGKIYELHGNEFGIIDEYTMEGELLGHITIGIQLITKVCVELNIDINNKDIVLLNHLILSHHGKLEYGSPRCPMTPEAQMLYQMDYNSTYMDMFNNVINTLNNDEFSNRQFLMDNRKIYKY